MNYVLNKPLNNIIQIKHHFSNSSAESKYLRMYSYVARNLSSDYLCLFPNYKSADILWKSCLTHWFAPSFALKSIIGS